MYEVIAVIGGYRSDRFSSLASAACHADDKVAETGQAHLVIEIKVLMSLSPRNRLERP